ncbi:MAG: type II toxin-antitoxin system RelE/ParE family toxin [Methylococcales bacterium]
MIKTFKCKRTESLFQGKRVAKWANLATVAIRKLQMLEAADSIDDLLIPPGNRLEKLSGDRANQWSIRVNEQFRVCFRFENGDAFDVEIVDYH